MARRMWVPGSKGDAEGDADWHVSGGRTRTRLPSRGCAWSTSPGQSATTSRRPKASGFARRATSTSRSLCVRRGVRHGNVADESEVYQALGTCLKTLRENQALLASRSSGNKRKPAVVSFKWDRGACCGAG